MEPEIQNANNLESRQNQKPNVSHAPIVDAPMNGKKKESGVGSMIAIIIILGLALIGLYYLSANFQGVWNEPQVLPTLEDVRTTNDPAIQAILLQSSSDEIEAIQTDVEETNFDGIDSELDAINFSLQVP